MPKPFSSESPCSGLLGVRDTWAWQYHHLTVNHLIHIFVPHVQGCVLPLGSHVSQWITIFLSQNSCLSFLIKGHLPPWGFPICLFWVRQFFLPTSPLHQVPGLVASTHITGVGVSGPWVMSFVCKQFPQIASHWKLQSLTDGNKGPCHPEWDCLSEPPWQGSLSLNFKYPGWINEEFLTLPLTK